MPVCSLQKVGCQNEGVSASSIVSESDYFGGISQLYQALKRSDFVPYSYVKVWGQLETILLPAFLSNCFYQLYSFVFFSCSRGLVLGNDLFDKFFLDSDILLNTDV